MTTKDDILRVLDQSETAGDPGNAERLIARANVLALLTITDAIERQTQVLEKIAGEHGIVTTQNADAFRIT
jgi:hypothetical protein